LLRAAIYRGDFGNIIWNTVQPDTPKHLPHDVAAPGAYFSAVVADLLISRTDAIAWLKRLNIAAPTAWQSVLANKRGPKPKYDLSVLRDFIFEQMDHHGPFDVSDPEWRGQADLVRAIEEQFGMSDSRAKQLLQAPLAEWLQEHPQHPLPTKADN
jgi:hypothetical protein